MKKIPTLFNRKFEDHKIIDITDEITFGCEEAFKNGIATIKFDGACCAIIDSVFYKRYDCKRGKKPPEGAIPCSDPDPITGHWPHWVEISEHNPSDKWFIEAAKNTTSDFGDYSGKTITFEAVGPHFNGNPYHLEQDQLVRHGIHPVKVCRDFDSIKAYLSNSLHEGLVFWLNDEPVCKIKRTDFGYEWPIKEQ